MIQGKCEVPKDFEKYNWPRFFGECIQEGHLVKSGEGVFLQVAKIIHTFPETRTKNSTADPMPFIIVKLDLP